MLMVDKRRPYDTGHFRKFNRWRERAEIARLQVFLQTRRLGAQTSCLQMSAKRERTSRDLAEKRARLRRVCRQDASAPSDENP